jgi:hypothetical protein
MEVIRNCKDKISTELSIYIPEKNLAIDFDGLYWNSEVFRDDTYHLDMTEECEKNGIRLIHIFEDEWNNKCDLVKRKLRYILGKAEDLPKIYARKCIVKEIKDSKKKNEFLEKYHIQGGDRAVVSLGLYYPNPESGKYKLVSIMTFCKPRLSLGQKKTKTKYDYELSRFASHGNYIVIGGFGKLFKYFEKNYNWTSLVTYADRRWSQGDVYLKNGWTFSHNSKPNYWYTDGKVRIHRFNFRKSELSKLFPTIYSDDKTEKEIMIEANYYRIYDCGNKVFTYERKTEESRVDNA